MPRFTLVLEDRENTADADSFARCELRDDSLAWVIYRALSFIGSEEPHRLLEELAAIVRLCEGVDGCDVIPGSPLEGAAKEFFDAAYKVSGMER